MQRSRSKEKANSSQFLEGFLQLLEDEADIEKETSRQAEGSHGQEALVVKMDFKKATKRARGRKRISRGIAHEKIKSLESENEKLQRKAWMFEKRIQRSHNSNAKQKKPHQQ